MPRIKRSNEIETLRKEVAELKAKLANPHTQAPEPQNRTLSRVAWTVVGTATILALVAATWQIATDAEAISRSKDALTALGALAVGFGVYVAWRRIRVQEEQARIQLTLLEVQQRQLTNQAAQIEIQDRNAQTAERGQMLERVTKAIDHIGSDQVLVRLGGLMSIVQAACEAPDTFKPIAFRALTGFLRERVRSKAELEQRSSPEDVAVALDLLLANFPADQLRDCDLSKTMVCDRSMDGFGLANCDLTEAHLIRLKLRYVIAVNIKAPGASFSICNLKGAHLRCADLAGAWFFKCQLDEVEFESARLHGARFVDCTGLTQEQLNKAYGDSTTLIPDGLELPSSWIEGPPAPATSSSGSVHPEE